jgi:hypothetical protein
MDPAEVIPQSNHHEDTKSACDGGKHEHRALAKGDPGKCAGERSSGG